MESAISAFCQSLAAFCHHVDTASKSLSDSIQRRPIPLDSAASAFLQSVDRRISSASADFDLLESMAFGTVSFEELLGHCNEVFKNNQRYIADLEERMQSLGYVPEVELEDDEVLDDSKFMSPVSGFQKPSFEFVSVSVVRSSRKRLEEDSLFEDSISLQNLGLSDAGLATLASEGNDTDDRGLSTMKKNSGETMSYCNDIISDKMTLPGYSKQALNASDSYNDEIPVIRNIAKAIVCASRDDYDDLPAFMKSLVSWEELQEAVVKINSFLSEHKHNDVFNQDEIEKMGLGRKARSYLLLLLRMNQFVAETIDNSIFYRVHPVCS
ncbi:uncharacterized protein LOC122008209 isoform X2 [Zingiber officinale]|uniref:Spindle and kinetochore-associated protein 3 n=1 Tax=Zingiber officinale TaxID=94328 RepID=A0A8J5FSK1_ZINOF|nr:uncharacterized protein LOC122008209 isoform X2 [Zingiber officinale]KAG6484796.1 hypothetical protein ZIOFF_053321 [Zingiber officinale]